MITYDQRWKQDQKSTNIPKHTAQGAKLAILVSLFCSILEKNIQSKKCFAIILQHYGETSKTLQKIF